MAMENNELLEALRHIIKEETRAAVKEEVQPIKDDINSINSRLDNMESDISEIKNQTKHPADDGRSQRLSGYNA